VLNFTSTMMQLYNQFINCAAMQTVDACAPKHPILVHLVELN